MSEINDILKGAPAYKPGGTAAAATASVGTSGSSEIEAALKDAPATSRGATGWARDAAAWAAKGAVAVPEAVVGLADIATGGRAGKLLENEGGAVGFRPKQAREAINEWHSDATKEAQRKFQEAEGLGGKFQAALENPSNIVGAVVESLPAMGAGGVVARGLGAATRLGQAGAKGAAAAGALGEGIVGAGSAAEQIRQESDEGLLSPGQTAAAAATGAATAGLGYAGGRVAQRLGIGDAETMLAQGNKGIAKQFADDAATAAANSLVQQRAVKSIPTQVIQGAISEGFLEELPQSVAEQIFQNLALGKDWSEDVDTAVVLGTLSGAAMGGGAAGYRAAREPRVPAGQPGDAAAQPPGAGAEPAGLPDIATYGPAIDQMVRPESQQQYRDALARAQDESLAPEDRKAAADSLHQAFSPDLFQQVSESQADGEVPAGLAKVRDEFMRQLSAQQEPVIDEARLREQGITPAPQLDTARIDAAVGALRPSEAMGLDPAAGSLSAAAALAVDSGAAAQAQQADALAQAAEVAARAPAKKKASERQVTADPATGEIEGGALATWTDEDLSNGFRSAQAKNVRLQLARELARRRAERDQQAAATAPASPPTTQQGSIDGTQADQAQPPRAESSQAAGTQGAPVAGPGPAQELTDGTTSSQHDGAQAGAAPGAQAQAPVQTPAQRIDAGRAAWASMPTAERKALAKRVGGVNAAIKGSLHGARWENLNAELQLRLADAMQPQGVINDSPAPAVRMVDERPAGPAAAAEAGGGEPAGRASDAQPAGPRDGGARQPAAGLQSAVPGRGGASEQAAGIAPAAAPAPTAGEQQAQAIAKEGNDARRAQLLAASERWTSMPAAERQAVAKAAKGLNALARAGAHTRAWADLAPKVREKLAAAMPDAATAPAGRAPARSVEGRDLGDGWAEFSRDSGSIGVPRAEMPQIRAEHRGAMVNFMNARGIAHQEESVQSSSLKPTQAEFSRERVARARGFEGGNRSILVSRDGHVLDGHHQWLAAREAGEDVKVIRLDAPIRELLDAAREFPSSTTSEGAVQAAAPASAPATKPKPRGVLAKKAAAEEAARVDYFTPGNIVKGYGDSHVRVVSYTPANADGAWSVTVRQVEKQGSGWEDVPGVRERTHATPPSARELKAGPVERTEDLPFRRGEADGQGLTDDQMANLLRIMRPEPAAFSDAARVQAVGQVRETVDAIRKGWSNGPEVVVAFDMNDPAVPEAARRADLRQRSGGASGAPEGFYWKGRAYLLASKLNTPADAARVLHHEVLGHHGLRGMFGSELNKILNQVATMRHAEVAAKIKEYGLRGVTDLSRRHAAEEVLAEMAEKTPQLHIVRRAVAAIRNWLRANVPGFSGLKLSDADIIQGYILPARDFVERGHRAATDRIEPSFSRGAAEMSLVDKARVLQGEPVAVLRGDEAPQGYPLLRAWATKVFKDAGGQAVNPELGAVVLDERAVRDSMAHGMNPFKAAAFAAVPRILEQGVVVAEGRANDVQSYFVSAPVQIKGVDDIVTVLVRQDVNSRRMYLHSVITKENLLKARDSGAGAEAPEERSGKVTSGDVASVLRGLLQINTREAAGQDGGEDLMFSRSRLSEIKNSALDQLQKTMSHPGKISVWDKTVGTMRHLAERVPAFKPVYEAAQRNIDDVSMLANDAADRAPRLLPRVDTIGDLVGKNRKTPVSAADNKAVAKPLFEGTLLWGRDVDGKAVLVDELAKKYGSLPADDKAQLLLRAGRLDDRMLGAWRGLPLAQYEANVNSRFDSKMLKAGTVWTDAELQTMFGASPNQIALYREARAAIDRSIDMTARADMMRALGDEYAPMRDMVLDAPNLSDALGLLTTTLQHDAKAKPELADRLMQLNNLVVDRAATAKDLQDAGYAPLSRFGRYTLDVVDQDGNRQYFGMYETMKDANLAKIQMAQAFPGAVITQGTMSQQSFKLFAGITPETLEIFKDMVVGKEADAATRKVYDEYLKLTKNNHSALKRLIQRKGIEGYSQDVGRVVANFVYSNARQGAAGLNAGTMDRAINDIPKDQGELKDLAMGLRSYIRDPQEEGQAVRGMLFAQYLGGSLASAFVNMTQPFAVTLPWLSQFGGIRAASGQMTRALKDMGTRGMKYETDLAHALKSAEDDGVVSPQEVHQLMAQARGAGGLRSGDGTRAGDARAAAGNAWERAKVAWGQPFALAEQFNRRSTFIAAFRIAKAQGMPDPGAFARKAVLETQFVYCVDSETECLTRAGWKRRDELTIGDVVLGVDELGQAVETPLLAVHRFPGRHSVTQFSNANRFSMVVTQGHRHVVQNYNSRDKVWQKPIIRTTAELRDGQHLLRVPTAEISRDGGDVDFAALLGWIAAEGNYARFRNCKDRRNVRIAQSASHNPAYVAEIERLLVALGGHYRRFDHPKNHNMVTFTLKKPLSTRVLEEMPEKLLTWRMTGEMSATEMRALLEAFAKGDGHRLKEGGWCIGQKQEQNLHVLQAMAVLCGQNATLYPAIDRERGKVAHLYLHKQGARTMVKQLTRTAAEVEDGVWCPETGTGTWIARRNGAVFVTGNSKANKPQWARGAVGGTLFTFKTYSVSYLELMQRMWKQGGPEGKRAVGWALAMLLLMGGAGGVPFAEDVEDLIDGAGQLMGYNISSKQWRKQALAGIVGKELGEFMEQGLSGLPGAPIDVSGRLGMGNLIPGTGLFLTKQSRERDLLEVVGPAGDLVARGFTAGRKVLTGDVAGAALEVSPTAVRNAAKGLDMAATGMYRDQKGYKVIDTTLAEAAAKAIGFQPKSVAEVQEANSFMLRSKSFYTQTSSEIKAQWAQAIFEKDDAALQRVRDRVADWNRNNPEQPIVVKIPDVMKRVREMNKDRTDRIADTSLKALRQQMREMAAGVG